MVALRLDADALRGTLALNQRGVHFVTIHRRGTSLVRKILERPASDGTSAVIDIPKRRQRHVRYLEQPVQLPEYAGLERQIAVIGLGREEGTLFLTNDFEARSNELIMNHARRYRIKDGMDTSVSFFHLDCLSSEAWLNVDQNITMAVLAQGCYRWLARQLKGFENSKPKPLSRKFVETGGVVEVGANWRLLVRFDSRSHNPSLREAALDRDCSAISWLSGNRIEFDYRSLGPRVAHPPKKSADFPLRKSAFKASPLGRRSFECSQEPPGPSLLMVPFPSRHKSDA